MKENEKLHRDCEQHTEENCDINRHHNLEPSKDECGHYVDEGPGANPVGDLNIRETDEYGRETIVAGGPKHNLDQELNKGPGVE